MPGVINDTGTTKKRKRLDPEQATDNTRNGKTRRTEKSAPSNASLGEEILLLESQILASRRHYNKITTLQAYCQDHTAHGERSLTAAVALCRVFCRLMAMGNMSKSRQASDNETTIVQWLRTQYESYKVTLLHLLAAADPGMQSTALTLIMRSLKEEFDSLNLASENNWREGTFASLVSILAGSSVADVVREEFVEKYLQPYDDVRYYGLLCFSDLYDYTPLEAVTDNVIFILSAFDTDLASKSTLDSFYMSENRQTKDKSSNLAMHRKQAQELWLKILKSDLTKSQRKSILNMMAHQIAPWFNRLEFLMDFLTDSFDAGGSMSLAALSGLFHLMQEKNLDYPQFYHKLYSLLSPEILHSKHRSRFFRLLDTFLASTHLPAVLVASFIKRLARLALNAPPSGIVVVIPWIYNLLRNHPTCTFMIHRKPEYSAVLTAEGMDDPFDMNETDPMETNAIESSLWEIHTLQSHYHPNVATIANIISAPFTKHAYNLEDFLDHTYSQMLGTELSKEIKKPPVVEYEIPKKVFFQNGDAPEKDSLLVRLWDFS
ncbi:MAG: hypothetical protein LQ341_005423 [Variospora aurantia]|nr:MAG: hypothetical protein LQ341_005423 [Variospora aurantia]